MDYTEYAASKLTSKYQATIPAPVRLALALNKGDEIIFDVRGEDVVLRKKVQTDASYLSGVEQHLSEWHTPEDDALFNAL